MLKRLSQRELLEQLAVDWQPQIRAAWRESLAQISSSIILARVIERLERGDVSGAVELLNIREEMFARVESTLLQAYNAGGQATVGTFPRVMDPSGNRILFTWGVRNLVGEQELRDHAARLVRGATQDMRRGIGEALSESLARGDNPRSALRQIVGRGRVDPRTGTRAGGLLGLTQRQMQTTSWVRRAMQEGDLERMREYLQLSPNIRDKRFDRSVAKAIREGRGFSAADADKIAGRYAERALDYRGKVLARHETALVLDKARDDAFRQQIADGKVDQQDITKTWFHTARPTQRDQHAAMNGQTVAYGENFTAPDGTQLRYPHDPEAPAEHTIGCFCRVEYRIDFAGRAARQFRAEQV